MVDYSESILSGAVLAGVDYSLNLTKGTKAITNGAILVGSDALIQMASAGDKKGLLRYFAYKQHEPLSVAVLYAIIQELLRYFGGRGVYDAEWRALLGNLFLASGSVALGIELNKALGMAPGSISVSNIIIPPSSSGSVSSNVGGKNAPSVRTVIM